MKASELRKGVLVNTPNNDQNPFRVDYFDENKVYQSIGHYKTNFGMIPFHPLTWDISDIFPIPLTPEILEKCEFEFEDNKSTRYGWYKRLSKDFSIVWYKTEVIGIEDNDSDVLIEVPCTYVHQLQNLIHSLTGKELEFKP